MINLWLFITNKILLKINPICISEEAKQLTHFSYGCANLRSKMNVNNN